MQRSRAVEILASHEPSANVKHAVLDYYYHNVVSLQDYLTSCFPGELELFDSAIDTPSYTTLLQRAYVAWSAPEGAPRPFEALLEEPLLLDDVIRRAQRDLLSTSGRPDNVICYGFVMSGGSVVNKYSNTSLAALQESKDWKAVLTRVSGPCLLHLLKHTSLFVPVLDNALRQICGPPLHSLKASSKRKADGKPSTKPKKLPYDPKDEDLEFRTPRILSRQSIFYTHMTSNAIKQSSGLQPDNALNGIDKAFPAAGLPEYLEDLAAARHLSKHVWPSKYHIAVTHANRNERRSAIDTGIVSIGKTNTPKCLKPALPLLQELLRRHRAYKYTRTLKHLAPSKLQRVELTPEERSILFNAISDDSSLPITQTSYKTQESSSCSQTTPSGLNFLPANASGKKATGKSTGPPRFTDFIIEHWRVTRFIQKCLVDMLPSEILGSQHNLGVITAAVDRFVTARRGETFSLNSIVRGFKMGDCKWSRASGSSIRPTVSAALLQAELVKDLVFWIFDHFIVDLLRANFYITESAAFQRRTLYFLQTDWLVICAPLVDNMANNLFSKMNKEEALAILNHPDRKLSFSHVRLLPKEKGVRPIVNLSRRPAHTSVTSTYRPPSINQLLHNAFSILSFEKRRREELTGSATQAFSDVYRRIKAYKQNVSSKTHCRLYMVKLDIRACFDSIDQDRLLQILETIISEDDYTITKYTTSVQHGGTVLRRFLRQARPTDDFAQFPEIAHQLADVLRRAVFVDQVRPATESREAVLALLREHIKDNIVKIGRSYYRQTVGIPQGSILSTLLCNFFYGYMEKEELGFTKQSKSILMRLVDDFLFVTRDQADAETFLRKMHEGHPDYGCFVSVDKTLVNFDYTLDGVEPIRRVDAKEQFPWCGLLFNQQTLEVRYDYGRRSASHMTNVLTVRTQSKPGEAFVNTMLYALKMRTNIIFFDTTFAQMRTIYINIYQALRFVAMKYHSYIKIWKPSLDKNVPFFLNVIHRIVQYAFLAIKSCFHPKLVAECGASYDGIRRGYVQWLGYRAFLQVLSGKPTKYKAILKHLRYICASRQYASMTKALEPVLAHPSNQQFDALVF